MMRAITFVRKTRPEQGPAPTAMPKAKTRQGFTRTFWLNKTSPVRYGRVIRENVYHVVPLPGVVWAAVRRELGDPWDIRQGMEGWVESR